MGHRSPNSAPRFQSSFNSPNQWGIGLKQGKPSFKSSFSHGSSISHLLQACHYHQLLVLWGGKKGKVLYMSYWAPGWKIINKAFELYFAIFLLPFREKYINWIDYGFLTFVCLFCWQTKNAAMYTGHFFLEGLSLFSQCTEFPQQMQHCLFNTLPHTG